MLVFHLFFELDLTFLVNFGVCSGSIVALEFGKRGCYFARAPTFAQVSSTASTRSWCRSASMASTRAKNKKEEIKRKAAYPGLPSSRRWLVGFGVLGKWWPLTRILGARDGGCIQGFPA